jgi:acid phosphatase family membrane protein YuiD
LIVFTVRHGIVRIVVVSIGAPRVRLAFSSANGARGRRRSASHRVSMIHTIGIASLSSSLLAQFLKVLVAFYQTKKFRLERFFDTGGMPSSHTALVTTLTIGVGLESGFASPLFSVVLVFSLYVIFEAAGLRKEVGKQARTLNELVDDYLVTHHLNKTRLKELVGHTWWEVVVGFVVGFAVAAVAYR